MKNYVPALAAALCLCGGSVLAQGIEVRVNGDPVRFGGVGPQQYEGRVMVPLRGVLEQMGAYVDWDQASETVIATKGDMTMRLPIGSRSAIVNGSRVSLDVPAMTIAGSTMVPLRFVSESLGADVRWDNDTRTVFIDTQGAIASNRGYAHRVDNGYMDRGYDRYGNGGYAHRTMPLPTVFSVTSNLQDNLLLPGERMRVTMRGTPGGKAYFRVRGEAGEMMMNEVEPGVYEGTFRNDTGHEMRIFDRDILAGVTVGDRASRETYVGGGTHQ